jgi:dTDP-4-amino-4,6-dideoxygalactose transaminase
MDAIEEIATKYKLFVVEDAAHAPGATYIRKGRDAHAEKLGTIGDVGCFSFFGNKNMTTGEGGMAVTDNDELATTIRMARSHGMTSLTWDRHKGHSFSYDVMSMGFNYRIDELRSGLGLTQLSKLRSNNKKRRDLWGIYLPKLGQVSEITVPFSHSNAESAYHFLPILLPKETNREAFMAHLRKDGIQTSIHYPPVHFFTYYRQNLPQPTELPITEDVGNREVTLPLFPTMQPEQVEYVVDSVKGFFVNEKKRG